MHMRRPLIALSLLLSGCGLFGGGGEASRKYPLAAPYAGLADKSLAIVVYAQPATINEYPDARKEISTFIAAQMREHLPNTRLLSPQDVIDWQDDTLNWYALTEKEIGRHFGVDRVLFVEVNEYGTHKVIGFSNMQGRLLAYCKVFDTEAAAAASTTPVWTGVVDASWPPDRPLDPTQTNEAAARQRVLDAFADRLVRYFYTQTDGGPFIRG